MHARTRAQIDAPCQVTRRLWPGAPLCTPWPERTSRPQKCATALWANFLTPSLPYSLPHHLPGPLILGVHDLEPFPITRHPQRWHRCRAGAPPDRFSPLLPRVQAIAPCRIARGRTLHLPPSCWTPRSPAPSRPPRSHRQTCGLGRPACGSGAPPAALRAAACRGHSRQQARAGLCATPWKWGARGCQRPRGKGRAWEAGLLRLHSLARAAVSQRRAPPPPGKPRPAPSRAAPAGRKRRTSASRARLQACCPEELRQSPPKASLERSGVRMAHLGRPSCLCPPCRP